MEFIGQLIELALRISQKDREMRDEGLGETKMEKRFRRIVVWFGIAVLVFLLSVCFAFWWWVARHW